MSAIILSLFLSASSGSAAAQHYVSPPAAAESPATAAKDVGGSGRFEMRDGTQSSAWLADRFRESLWQMDVRLREYQGQGPRSLDAYLASTDYNTVRRTLDLTGIWNTGHTTHTWVFDAPDPPGGMPDRALELEDLSGPDGYHVRATVHCYDAPEFCEAYRNRQMPLLAPKPAATAGDLALGQWHERILTESCTVFARNMRQPAYPTAALRDGIEGMVLVGIAFNSCGNVRDAWIQQSSGNPELDRAAVKQALKWQIDAQSLPKPAFETGRATVPIRFVLDDALATEADAASIN